MKTICLIILVGIISAHSQECMHIKSRILKSAAGESSSCSEICSSTINCSKDGVNYTLEALCVGKSGKCPSANACVSQKINIIQKENYFNRPLGEEVENRRGATRE